MESGRKGEEEEEGGGDEGREKREEGERVYICMHYSLVVPEGCTGRKGVLVRLA